MARSKRREDKDLDEVAWRILSDVLQHNQTFAGFPAGGLQQLIELRLAEEAKRLNLDPEKLGRAFERALREFTGAGHPPREPAEQPEASEAGDDDETETID